MPGSPIFFKRYMVKGKRSTGMKLLTLKTFKFIESVRKTWKKDCAFALREYAKPTKEARFLAQKDVSKSREGFASLEKPCECSTQGIFGVMVHPRPSSFHSPVDMYCVLHSGLILRQTA
jgi:hypothetical protein